MNTRARNPFRRAVCYGSRGGTHCGVVNAGAERYRQIAVELK